jgi:Tol biopolymer transport system component
VAAILRRMRGEGRAFSTATIAMGVAVLLLVTVSAQRPSGLQVEDIYQLRSVGDVHLSPDGTRVAYTVSNQERPGRPYSQVWIADLSTGRASRSGGDRDTGSGPRWSPDGRRIAYIGSSADRAGLLVRDVDSSDITYVAGIEGTNHPLPSSGERISWAPDGKRLAFVSTTPGPEADANGDPMVITRYLYKPTATEGETRFNDNRRRTSSSPTSRRGTHARSRPAITTSIRLTGRQAETRSCSFRTAVRIRIGSSTTTSSPCRLAPATCAVSPTRRVPSTFPSGRQTVA